MTSPLPSAIVPAMTENSIPRETRLASSLQIAEMDYESLGEDVRRVAARLAENAERLAATGQSRGGVRAYGQDGAELDELLTKRGEAWIRLQALRYVESGTR